MIPAPDTIWIEGYAGKVSYLPGEALTLHISSPNAKCHLEIIRVGATREKMHEVSGIAVAAHPIPQNASSHGCNWPTAFTFAIPENWKSGYYEVIMSVSDSGGSYAYRSSRSARASAFFILLPNPSLPSGARILLQLSTNTYNAYNNWNGHSLYAYHAIDKMQGRRVSFLRPPQSQFASWEEHFVRWAEKAGYQIDYCANLDLEYRAELLSKYKLILSLGHDEYWSWGMRDAIEKYITNGGNVAFFSGNTCCWQVRPEENGQALACYKQAVKDDPLYGQGHDNLLSTLWSHHLVARPENQLTGVGFLWGGYHKSHEQFMDGSGAFTVHRPDHWIYEGTGLARNSEFGGKDTIVGYECDGCELTYDSAGLPIPTHSDGTPENFQILATAPAKWHPDDCEWYERWEKGRVGAAVMGLYERGGTVVTVGSTDWSHGLREPDPIVDRITRNILNRLST